MSIKEKIVVGVLLVIVGVMGVMLPIAKKTFGSSVVGSTFLSAKTANVVVDTSKIGQAGTSTSILNSDANDRIIKQAQYYCTNLGSSFLANNGTGIANLIFTAATSSTQAPAALSNTNYVLNTTIATTTAELFISSTTPGLSAAADFRVWKAGSYLTFFSNATNTATCIIGVDYMGT